MAYSPAEFITFKHPISYFVQVYVKRKSQYVGLHGDTLICSLCKKSSQLDPADTVGEGIDNFLHSHTHRTEEETDYGNADAWQYFLGVQ